MAADIPPAIRAEMAKAIEDSNKPTADDKKGGFHEEYGVAGLDKSDKWVVSRDTPGRYGNPNDAKRVEPSGTPASGDVALSIVEHRVVFHVHPRGRTATGKFCRQPPSPEDIAEAIPGQISIVFAAGEKKVYFYDSSGVIGKPMDLKDFVRQ